MGRDRPIAPLNFDKTIEVITWSIPSLSPDIPSRIRATSRSGPSGLLNGGQTLSAASIASVLPRIFPPSPRKLAASLFASPSAELRTSPEEPVLPSCSPPIHTPVSLRVLRESEPLVPRGSLPSADSSTCCPGPLDSGGGTSRGFLALDSFSSSPSCSSLTRPSAS